MALHGHTPKQRKQIRKDVTAVRSALKKKTPKNKKKTK